MGRTVYLPAGMVESYGFLYTSSKDGIWVRKKFVGTTGGPESSFPDPYLTMSPDDSGLCI